MFKGKFLESWSLLSTIRKPIIAAVSGYAVSPGTLSFFYLPGLVTRVRYSIWRYHSFRFRRGAHPAACYYASMWIQLFIHLDHEDVHSAIARTMCVESSALRQHEEREHPVSAS